MGAHLQPSTLRNHFPSGSTPSWRSVEWQRGQLADMVAAGIDAALPVYWGFDRPQDEWSTKGLDVLAQALTAMKRAGQNRPLVGMFFDTTIVARRDLTTDTGRDWFYQNFRDFFRRIPRESWADIDGRPMALMFN